MKNNKKQKSSNSYKGMIVIDYNDKAFYNYLSSNSYKGMIVMLEEIKGFLEFKVAIPIKG